MWKRLLLVVVAMLPVHAEAACTRRALQGRYAVMIAGELSGFWTSCNVRVNASGFATGSCLESTGRIGPLDPIQFSVKRNCFVSGNSASGVFSYSARVQPHKRGLIGRFVFFDGVDFFEGPLVAVKRGR